MLNAATDFGTPLDAVAHIIRMALTPVFLLLSLSALLNVFSTQLGLVGTESSRSPRPWIRPTRSGPRR